MATREGGRERRERGRESATKVKFFGLPRQMEALGERYVQPEEK